MRCPEPDCRSTNTTDATDRTICGAELRDSRWSAFLDVAPVWVFGVLIVYLTFGGIYFAFSRHGRADGVTAIVIPPYAWYRAVSPLWDTPKWEQEALDGVESVALIVLYFHSGNADMMANMAEAIPKLKRRFQKVSPEFRESLDRSLTALIDFMDVIHRDLLDETLRGENPATNKEAIIRRYQTLYDRASTHLGVRAAMETAIEATMLDNEVLRSRYSATDINNLSPEDKILIRAPLKQWKDGAMRTKDRILR